MELASKGGGWVGEAYFSLLCHEYLPESVDRILYIDAGDVIFNGDFEEYYNYDFNGQALIVTLSRMKEDGSILELNDLMNYNNLLGIKRGIFKSGSYVINGDYFRNSKIDMAQYIALLETIAGLLVNEELKYFGDQGFLSITYLGRVTYYAYPQSKNLWYMPYNFCLWFFERGLEMFGDLWYQPKIIHFAGAPKPWKIGDDNKDTLKEGQLPYYEHWHKINDAVQNEIQSLM